MSDLQHGELNADDARRSWWRGTAAGGPLDGSEISVEASPGMPLRGLQVNACIGEDIDTAEWHVYQYWEGVDLAQGVFFGTFAHIGTIEGDPKAPSS
jgi:hypothetical protein